MKEKLKAMRINVTLSAIISMIIGILFLVFPDSSISMIGTIIACVVILAGVIVIISQVVDFGRNVMGIIVGAVITLIGIDMLISPSAIMTIIPIAIGVLLCVHGLQDLSMAVESAKAHADRVWIAFVIAAVNIILGLVCILNAFGLVSLAFRIIGIMLIWDGISDLGLVHKVKKATGGVVDSTIISEEDIF